MVEQYLTSLFFSALFLELFLAGSGRVLSLTNSLTLRMCFYISAECYFLIKFLYLKIIKDYVAKLCLLFLCLLLLGVFTGFLNGASSSLIFNDVKPLLYFFMILPFSLFLEDIKNIYLVVNLIKISALIMTLVYLMLFISMNIGLINFSTIYRLLGSMSDVKFKGMYNAFFYKSFLYLGIGFFFFFFSSSRKEKILSYIILLAILLTFMRGFIFSFIVCTIIYNFLRFLRIKDKKSIYSIIIFIIIMLFLYILAKNGFFYLLYRSYSDRIRYIEFYQVISKITILSFWIGHGFGIGIPIRPIHMEIAYLEIFHKQGVLGLMFWLGLFFCICKEYAGIPYENYLAMSFFMSTLYIYIESFTNPFINNSIGMSMILISLISLNTIRNYEKN